MKDLNLCRISGTIFWSKLEDRTSFSILRLGINLFDATSLFCIVNNPNSKIYDIIKAGNKVILSNGWLDTWEKPDGSSDILIKANSSGIDFFNKEKVIPSINDVIIVGRVLSYTDDIALVEMFGDRNPKTDQPTIRKVRVVIGNSYKEDIVNHKIILHGKIAHTVMNGKSKVKVNANYDSIGIL